MDTTSTDTTECALCGAEFIEPEEAWDWEAEANDVAGGMLMNPGGSWWGEAIDQLGLDRNDATCVPCSVNRIHSLAWELRQAEEDEHLRQVQERTAV